MKIDKDSLFSNGKDFVVSTMKESAFTGCFNSRNDSDYLNLICRSLGDEVMNSNETLSGNCSFMKNGKVCKRALNLKGVELAKNLPELVAGSRAVRFDIYDKPLIDSKSPNICNLVVKDDFKVNVSVVPKVSASIKEAFNTYFETIRAALGEEIVGSSNMFCGSYVLLQGDGATITMPFRMRGVDIMSNMRPYCGMSVAVRININQGLPQGGYKSWIITN